MSDVFLYNSVCVCSTPNKPDTFETPKSATTYILAVNTIGKINKHHVYKLRIYIKNMVIFIIMNIFIVFEVVELLGYIHVHVSQFNFLCCFYMYMYS